MTYERLIKNLTKNSVQHYPETSKATEFASDTSKKKLMIFLFVKNLTSLPNLARKPRKNFLKIAAQFSSS